MVQESQQKKPSRDINSEPQNGKPVSPMTIVINVFGTEFVLKRQIALDLESPTLRDVLVTLRRDHEGPWNRFLKEDLSLQEG